jgi:hypothetical protein
MITDIKYQPFTFTVVSPGQSVSIEFDTDKLYQYVTGIFFSLPSFDAASSVLSRLEIAGKEIFPDGYEVRMLSCDWSQSPNNLYLDIQAPAAGNRIKTSFTDSGISGYPYQAVLYLRLENNIN